MLALRRPLSPYYVLNVGEEAIELTGVIEMTNLVRAEEETAGLSLVYVPKYMDSEDPMLAADDRDLERSLMDRGMKKLFPDLDAADIAYAGIHRAKYVQPLPLVDEAAARRPVPSQGLEAPFQVVNTSMLHCATLNNDEVVALVDRFVASVGARLISTEAPSNTPSVAAPDRDPHLRPPRPGEDPARLAARRN